MWNERFNKEFKEESKKETNEKSKNELKKELFGDEFYEEMEPEKRLEIFQKNIESDNNKELRECLWIARYGKSGVLTGSVLLSAFFLSSHIRVRPSILIWKNRNLLLCI